MGGKCPHRKVKKRRYSHKTSRRTKFEIKDILSVVFSLFFFPRFLAVSRRFFVDYMKTDEEKKPLPVDEDLPGMGQYYCLHCDRYFASVAVRDEHFKTKRHRKRVKQMMGPKPHTQLDADLAAGMGMPDNGPKLMS
ncbi:hypothetical protein C3L33_02626, partial [Rhododendron williamsianum]